jgi:hypothetical protein
VHLTRRYFAYRKGLLKLNITQVPVSLINLRSLMLYLLNLFVTSSYFLQFNGDPGKALQWLKASTRWSELPNDELRRGLKVPVAIIFHKCCL